MSRADDPLNAGTRQTPAPSDWRTLKFIKLGFLIMLPISLVSLVGALTWGLAFTPPDHLLGETVRSVFIHAPIGNLSVQLPFILSVFAVLAILVRVFGGSTLVIDMLLSSTAWIGLAAVIGAGVTGAIWGIKAWGTYWEWQDPRSLTSTILAGLLVIYIMREHLMPSRKPSILLLTLLMISAVIVRIAPDFWPSLHQPNIRDVSHTIDPVYARPLLACKIGWLLFASCAILGLSYARIVIRRRGA